MKPVTEEDVDKFIRALKRLSPTMKEPPRAVVRAKLEGDRLAREDRAAPSTKPGGGT